MEREMQEGVKTLFFSLGAFAAALAVASLIYWNWRIRRIVKRIEVIVEDVGEQERLQKL